MSDVICERCGAVMTEDIPGEEWSCPECEAFAYADENGDVIQIDGDQRFENVYDSESDYNDTYYCSKCDELMEQTGDHTWWCPKCYNEETH